MEGSRLFAPGGGGTNYEVLHLETMLVCAPATQRTSRCVQKHIKNRDRNLLVPFQTREICICTTPGYTVVKTRALEASGLFSPVLTASPVSATSGSTCLPSLYHHRRECRMGWLASLTCACTDDGGRAGMVALGLQS